MQSKQRRTSIGCAIVYVQENEDLSCVGDATTKIELAELLLAIPEDTYYEVHILANGAIVGNGTYIRWGDRLRCEEHGACRGVFNSLGNKFEVVDMLAPRRAGSSATENRSSMTSPCTRK